MSITIDNIKQEIRLESNEFVMSTSILTLKIRNNVTGLSIDEIKKIHNENAINIHSLMYMDLHAPVGIIEMDALNRHYSSGEGITNEFRNALSEIKNIIHVYQPTLNKGQRE